MTIDRMIQLLEDFRHEHGGDAEIRLMTQQNWPFENGVYGVTSKRELDAEEAGDCEDDDADGCEPDGANVVYIVEGDQICYGDKRAWEISRSC